MEQYFCYEGVTSQIISPYNKQLKGDQMSAFPNSLPTIPRITSPTTQYMDDPGIEAYALHNQIAGEVEAMAFAIGVVGSSVEGTVVKRLSDVESEISVHTHNTSNPHGVTKSQVGLGNCDNTSDLSKPVSTAQAAAIAAAVASVQVEASAVQSVAGRTGAVTLTTSDVSGFNSAAASAAPVQSVAGRTGAVTLTTSDVSGFNSAAASAAPVQSVAGMTGAVTLTTSDVSGFNSAVLAAAPAETVTTVGNLIGGATTKATLASTDLLGVADSAASNVLKSVAPQALLSLLNKLGVAKPFWMSGIPFVMPAGDGGSTGLSFTGVRGVFTMSSAILSGVSGILGGCYMYLPAGAGGIGSSGLYWAVFNDDTNGEVYNTTYVPGTGTPTWQNSPTAFGNLTAGRITQTTSEITVASCSWSGNSLGVNGTLRVSWKQIANSSANGKQFAFKVGSTFLAYMSITTASLDSDKEAIIQNSGRTDRQIVTRKNDGIGASTTSYNGDGLTLDTTVDQTISMTIKLTANTDSAVFVPRLITSTCSG